jgi:hypothetical protein
MNGYDIQQYNYFIDVVLENTKIKLSTKGDAIVLQLGKETIGQFINLNEAIQFVFGFKFGLSKNKKYLDKD